jgi:putative transposase
MIRSFRYPLHPTIAQAEMLTSWLAACCDLYNGALQERCDAYRKQGRTITLYEQQQSLTEIRRDIEGWFDVPCTVARSALRRLDRAYKAFFRRVQSGKTPGFPRFRGKQWYDSFSFQGPRRVEDGRVLFPRIGPVKVNFYRPLVGKLLDVIVRRDGDRWWVVFQVDLGLAPAKVDLAKIPESRMIGVDVGLTTLATLSNGEKIANPRHGKTSAQVLADRQRKLARKRKGSASRRRAALLVRKAQNKIHNQRKDTACKAAADLVSRFDLICFEKLNITGLANGVLGKFVRDAAWRMLIGATTCKAESAGKYAVDSDARGTSIKCSECEEDVPKGLGDRTHRCPRCGLVLCRDVNAARNILTRGKRVAGLHETPRVTAEGPTIITEDAHSPLGGTAKIAGHHVAVGSVGLVNR